MAIDYECPRCNSREIIFREIAGDKIVFHCNFCKEDFIAEDKESGYLRQKVARLRQRYPEKTETLVKKGG
jgi:ribosomal protein L37AE/L43A